MTPNTGVYYKMAYAIVAVVYAGYATRLWLYSRRLRRLLRDKAQPDYSPER